MTINTIDLVIILAYFAMMIGCGVIGMFMSKSNEDFFVADRRLGFFIYFPCLASVILGGGATFATTKLSYLNGVSGAWIVYMYGFGIMAMGLLLASKLANLRVISLSEMLKLRYGLSTQCISAVIASIYAAMIAVVQIIAIGTVLKTFMGWSFESSMLTGGGISLAYTLAGGMWSVTITDFIQFWLMVIGVFFFLIPMGLEQVGGFSALAEAVPESYFDFTALGSSTFIQYFLLMFLGIIIGQDIWQRVFTAKNARVATIGTMTAGVFSLLWGGAMALAGMMAFVLLPNLENPQDALPELVVTVLSPGVKGVVLAGLLSTLMSTISGTILASSTLIINDLIKPFKGEMVERRGLQLSRLVTVSVGIVCLLLAIAIGDVLVALDVAYAYLSGCIFIPVIAGFFWSRATGRGALISIVASAITVTVSFAVWGVTASQPIMLGMVVSAISLVFVSLNSSPDQALIDDWENQLANTTATQNSP